ncbi:MAG: hypothetical protein HKN36_09330 [Hellea sp.]|nr:hypothetical protein [Hellea sp.]
MTDFYLLAAERTCSAKSLAAEAYRNPAEDTVKNFLKANSFKSHGDRMVRGELYAVPSLSEGPRLEPGQVGKAVSKTNFMVRNQRAKPAPEEFNANFHWLHDLVSSDRTKIGLTTAEGTMNYFGARADRIANLFEDYEAAYRVTALSGSDFLKGTAANSARHFIEKDLTHQLTGISRRMFLENPHRTSLKDQMGISHKSLRNQVKTGKDLSDLNAISNSAAKARGVTAHLRRGGYVVKAMSVGSTYLDVKSAFDTGGTEAGMMKAGEESFKLAGSVAGGSAGAMAGTWIAGGLITFFGVSTGGLGFVAIAVGGAVVGSVAGGAIGESLGDTAWGEWGDDIYTIGDEGVEYLQKKFID